jgi:hypothetical protein
MYDFRLETQRDVAVYVSTLFTLMQDAHQHGALDACRFLRSKLAGMVPADALTAFVDGLGDVPDAPKPAIVEPPPPPNNNTMRRVPTQSKTLAW